MAGVLRNSKSGLVLDASQYEVKLQHFTEFHSQLWIMESAGHGKLTSVCLQLFLYIGSKAMDIQGGISSGSNLITYQKHGGANQQWFINSDNTIVSSSGNLAVDIWEGRFNAEAKVIVHPKHGGQNQLFYFQPQ